MLLIETEAIHRVHHCRFVLCVLLPMTLETELLCFTLILELNIVSLNAATTLNRPNAETLAVSEAVD